MNFSIGDLKKHLGPGLGLRKNKYMLEIPIPGIDGAKINVLARSAGLPERSISTTQVYHKGRKYQVRGETDYGGSYVVSIVDDSNMDIRKRFDAWMKTVDNSKPVTKGVFAGASYESGLSDFLSNVQSGLNVINKVKDVIKSPVDTLGQLLVGKSDPSLTQSTAKYQSDINVWQLSNQASKVYGYKLQNAFPSQLGIVTLDDGNPNTLSEFSVTFSYSEFVPLDGTLVPQQILNALIGDSATAVVNSINAL